MEWRADMELARRMCAELAHLCKHVLMDSAAKPSRRMGPSFPLEVLRELMRTQRRIAELHALAHEPLPHEFWHDLHHAYRIAAWRGCLERSASPVEDESLAEIYLSILLIELADTQRMPRHEMPWLFDFVRLFAHLVERVPAKSGPPGVFVLDSRGNAPPQPLLLQSMQRDWDLSLRTTPLIKQIALILAHQEARADNLARSDSAVSGYARFLQHLRLRWSGSRFRRGVRRRSDPAVQYMVSFGFSALSDALAQGPDGRPFHEPRAALLNSSAGGLALSLAAEAASGMEVGELVGTRRVDGGPWEVGVLRWFSLPRPNRLAIGVQLLTGSFMPATPLGEAMDDKVLLTRAGQPGARGLMLCAAGLSAGDTLVLRQDDKEVRVQVRKRLDIGSCVPLYRVEWLRCADETEISPVRGG